MEFKKGTSWCQRGEKRERKTRFLQLTFKKSYEYLTKEGG